MKKYYLLSIKESYFSFRFKVLTLFILLFSFNNKSISQTKFETSKIEKHSHNKNKEALLESILPFEKYFSIISKIENNNNIYNTDRNYFFKFIQPTVSLLRKKVIADNESKKLDLTKLLDEFGGQIAIKAAEFNNNKKLIIDKIENPLKYTGHNFRTPTNPDQIMTPGVPCTNEGFESNNFSAWAGSWGEQECLDFFCFSTDGENDPYYTNGLVIGGNNTTTDMHTIVTPGTDAIVPIQRVRPGGGGFAMRLNDQDYNDYSAARLIQTFRVTPANENFTYYFAVALENGGHTLPEQPYFRIRMYDQNGVSINCASFDVDATSAGTIGGFITQGLFSYRDWSAVFVPLQAYVNQDVTIEFIVTDCTQGGHLGYAYIDADCQPFQLLSQSPLICAGVNNTLTAPAGAASYTWTATGGGNIVSGANSQVVTVNQGGTYAVTMTAFGSGCSYTIDTIMGSNPSVPVANFSNNTPCVGVATNFTDLSTGGCTGWNWDFGDGQTSTLQNPSHTYAAAGTYTITLDASNGCIDTYTATVVIAANSTAAFTTNSICEGAITNFTNTSTAPAGSTFNWDFGDGQNISNAGGNVTHTYSGDATYSATLQITAPGGCNGTVTNNVIVNANPSPSFTNNSVCLTTGTQFNNTTPAVPAITTWAWDFTNNGSTDDITQSPAFTYPTAGTFTALLTATTGAGCVGTYTANVTVNPNPVASFTATTECLNVATAFNSNASTIAAPDNIAFYNWTFGDGQNASGSNTSHTYTSCGNFTVNLTVVSNNNCVNSTTGTITVKCIPTVAVPTNTIVCPATAIAATNFTSNPAGATYTWANTQPSINLGASGIGDIPSFNTTNTGATQLDGAITVTPTLLGCLGTPSTYTVSVRPTPVMTPISSVTYCPSNAVPAANFASTPTGSTFAWTNTQTLIGLAANGGTPYAGFSATNTGTTSLSGTISVTPTLNTCVGLPITYNITVNPTPVATVPANATYCSLDVVPATGFNSNPAGAIYTWTNTNNTIGLASSGNGQIATFNTTNITSAVQTGIIAVTPTLNSCVGLPVSYTITVNPTPIISPIADVLECPAVNIATNNIVSTPAGATFAWTNSNSNIGLAATSGTGNITAFTTSNLTASNEVSTITITPTLNSCVGPSISYTITVKPTPILNVPASLSYCPNVTTVPSSNFSSTPSGATINWTNNNTSIGLAAIGTNDYPAFTPLNVTSINQVSTINATPTLNSCVGIAQTYSITVFPKPIASVPLSSKACPGDNIIGFIFGSTPNDPNTNYNWIHTNANIGLTEGTTIAETSSNSSNFIATNINNTFITSTFTLITDLNGCFSDPQSFSFTVNPLPLAVFETSHTCFGESTQFNSTSSVGSGSIVSHQWDYNNDNMYEVNGNNPNPSTILSSIGNQNIHLNVITDEGCVKDTVIAMYVNPNPVPTISVDDPDGCPDHLAGLTGGIQAASVDHSNSIVSWIWDFEGNSYPDHTSHYANGSEADSIDHTFINTSPTQSAFYQITLIATNDSGCVGSFTTNSTFITVFANPIANFTYGPNDPLPGVDNPLVQFIDESQGASNWNWNFGDSYSSNAANISNFQNPQHYYESYDAQSYNVTLIINNGQCWDTIIKPIPILPNWTFYIPNAFSPNEDGINDGFRATGVGIKEFKIFIFDRWGEQIWYSNDLEEYWDGKVTGKNKIVQQDVYIWKVQFKDGKGARHNKAGTVTVVR